MQIRWSFLVFVIAWLFAGCTESKSTECAGGRLCPEGTLCAPAGGCAPSGAVRSCSGKADDAECNYPDVSNGFCSAGVCLPVGCGNGVIETDDDGVTEVCDDGNNQDRDGCSANCRSDESCGNGVRDDAVGEFCDDGNTDDGDECNADCTSPSCGDGAIDTQFNEACDCGVDPDNLPADCNGINSDSPDATCRGNCQPGGVCGDNIVDVAAGENCDDGNFFPGDGCSGACIAEVCGNGVLDLEVAGTGFLPSEECDDGENGLNHDGCVQECRAEAPRWTASAPAIPTAPSSGSGAHAMVYDAARGKLLLFGGQNNGIPSRETWEFDGAAQTWTQVALSSPTTPSSRSGHAMAYDAARGKVLLFGGTSDGDETWEFDGATQTWTQVAQDSLTIPSTRFGHAMAYDAARGKIVLFGGLVDGNSVNAETWDYDGVAQTWTQVAQSSSATPSARESHSMAYDAARGKVMLFGGNGGGVETWEFDGLAEEWTRVAEDSPRPTDPSGHAMAYDAARGKVVLFGGTLDGDETWEYDGVAQTWTQIAQSSPATPTLRSGPAIAYDTTRGKIMLFGGSSGSDETWEFDGLSEEWTQVALSTNPTAPSPRLRHSMAYDAARGKVLLFGGSDGSNNNGETWEFDGSTQAWTQVTPLTAPLPRSSHAMAYDAARRKVLLFGGRAPSTIADTWEFDGLAAEWTQVAQDSLTIPSTRFGHAMVYDAARSKVVLFGGRNRTSYHGDTWEYDGSTAEWTQIAQSSLASPSPRKGHAMAYDAARGKVLLFGGRDGFFTDYADTWEFDGLAGEWTLLAESSPTTPSPRMDLSMAYNAVRGEVLLFGGNDASGPSGETWEFDRSNEIWTEVAVTSPNAPSPRLDHAMAYDAARGKVLLFGGDGVDGTNGETWAFRYDLDSISESCTTGLDGDGDTLIGCADPDCWGSCTPLCVPNTTTNWPSDCDTTTNACGDGVCNAALESCRLCPSDCGTCTPACGDFICEGAESQANCPGDCAP